MIACQLGPAESSRACWRRIPAAVAAGLLLLGGCYELVNPGDFPAEMEPLTPPAEYRGWWREVEACSGRTGSFARVNWFVIPESDYVVYRGSHYAGFWSEYRHTIILAATHVSKASVVRHEMLHDLLNSGDHPAEYFARRCGGVVSCSQC